MNNWDTDSTDINDFSSDKHHSFQVERLEFIFRLPSFVLRPSSFVIRPPSLVLRRPSTVIFQKRLTFIEKFAMLYLPTVR